MTVKFRLQEKNTAHGIVAVFIGPDVHHLARAGEIVLRIEEWNTLVLGGATILVEDKQP